MLKTTQKLKFPLFLYPTSSPIEFIDPLIKRLSKQSRIDGYIEIPSIYTNVLTKKKVIYHLDKLVSEGLLEKLQYSERKFIYEVAHEQFNDYAFLSETVKVDRVFTLFPQTIHGLSFFNSKRMVMTLDDFTKRITTSFSSDVIKRWFPNSDITNRDFQINMKTPKGTLTTVTYLKVLLVIQTMAFQSYKAKKLAEKLHQEIDFNQHKEYLLEFKIKISNIVKVFDSNMSAFYVRMVVEAIKNIEKVIFRIPKEYYENDAGYIYNYNPYSLGFPDNYKLIQTVNYPESISSKSTIVIKLNAYYEDYFEYLYALEEENELRSIPVDRLVDSQDIICKIDIMLFNLMQLRATNYIRLRAFFKLFLIDRLVQSKADIDKINNAMKTYMLMYDNCQFNSEELTYTIHINDYEIIFNQKEQNIHLKRDNPHV